MKYLIAIILAALCGCASSGRNFDSRNIAQIKKGETTEADLVAMFGKPQTVSVNSETGRRLVWIYAQAIATPFGATTKSKTIVAFLDPNGVVKNYEYSSDGFDTSNSIQRDPESKPAKPIKAGRGSD